MVEIVIKIPKGFEEHYALDKFEDSLQRLRFDVHKSLIAGRENILSGNYEIETLDMLTEAFLNSTSLPKGHRLMDADKFVNSLKGIERLHIDDELRSSILDAVNTNIFVYADKEDEE